VLKPQLNILQEKKDRMVEELTVKEEELKPASNVHVATNGQE
jgi:hypothetical protein